jgi:UrcA family protein
MNNRLNLRNIALLAGAVLLSSSAIAMPLGAAVTRTETVKYSAQKAGTTEGAAELYQKLHGAAVRVCLDADLATVDSYESCVSDALDKAVLQVSIPMVSALHLQSLIGGKMTSTKRAPATLEAVASR